MFDSSSSERLPQTLARMNRRLSQRVEGSARRDKGQVEQKERWKRRPVMTADLLAGACRVEVKHAGGVHSPESKHECLLVWLSVKHVRRAFTCTTLVLCRL